MGEKVTIVGWMENVRGSVSNLAFVVLRDFYGTTQVVAEDEAMLAVVSGVNWESTISVAGTVRERARRIPSSRRAISRSSPKDRGIRQVPL